MLGYRRQGERVAARGLGRELLSVAGSARIRSQVRLRRVVEDVQGLRKQGERCRREPL